MNETKPCQCQFDTFKVNSHPRNHQLLCPTCGKLWARASSKSELSRLSRYFGKKVVVS